MTCMWRQSKTVCLSPQAAYYGEIIAPKLGS